MLLTRKASSDDEIEEDLQDISTGSKQQGGTNGLSSFSKPSSSFELTIDEEIYNPNSTTNTDITKPKVASSQPKHAHHKPQIDYTQKIEEYKHIKPMRMDDSLGARRSIYPSLNDIMTQDENVWMSVVFPTAPLMDTTTTTTEQPRTQVSYPDLSSSIRFDINIKPPRSEHVVVDPSESEEEKKAKEMPPELPKVVVHKLVDGDTLFSLSIKYGVEAEAIKIKNRIMGDDLSLYCKTELEIPDPTQLPNEKPLELTKEELQKIEDKKRSLAMTLFMKLCGVGEDEARYYLSIHDFDLRMSVKEYKEDIEWEKEFAEKMKQKKKDKERRRKARLKHSDSSSSLSLAKLLTVCFPFGKGKFFRAADDDVELDLIEDIDVDSD